MTLHLGGATKTPCRSRSQSAVVTTPSAATSRVRTSRPSLPTSTAGLAQVASRTKAFDEYTVALLTALNLASENQRLRRELALQLDELDRDVASVAAMVEAALPAGGD